MSETPNITTLRRRDGTRPALREVIADSPNGLRRPDSADEGLKQRTVAFIRRVWPENTVKHLATALNRKSSLSGAQAIIEMRQAMTASDILRLSRHAQFGRAFILYAYDYPESPDYREVLEGIQRVRDAIAKI